MDSGMSNDAPKSKKDKKQKKNKDNMSGPSQSSGHGSHHHQPPQTTTVNIINEHNHSYQHNKSPNPGGRGGEISAGGVTLDRLDEETENLRRQNSHGGDDPAGLGRSGNLYRVYNATTA